MTARSDSIITLTSADGSSSFCVSLEWVREKSETIAIMMDDLGGVGDSATTNDTTPIPLPFTAQELDLFMACVNQPGEERVYTIDECITLFSIAGYLGTNGLPNRLLSSGIDFLRGCTAKHTKELELLRLMTPFVLFNGKKQPYRNITRRLCKHDLAFIGNHLGIHIRGRKPLPCKDGKQLPSPLACAAVNFYTERFAEELDAYCKLNTSHIKLETILDSALHAKNTSAVYGLVECLSIKHPHRRTLSKKCIMECLEYDELVGGLVAAYFNSYRGNEDWRMVVIDITHCSSKYGHLRHLLPAIFAHEISIDDKDTKLMLIQFHCLSVDLLQKFNFRTVDDACIVCAACYCPTDVLKALWQQKVEKKPVVISRPRQILWAIRQFETVVQNLAESDIPIDCEALLRTAVKSNLFSLAKYSCRNLSVRVSSAICTELLPMAIDSLQGNFVELLFENSGLERIDSKFIPSRLLEGHCVYSDDACMQETLLKLDPSLKVIFDAVYDPIRKKEEEAAAAFMKKYFTCHQTTQFL